jgi:hypothetical protein
VIMLSGRTGPGTRQKKEPPKRRRDRERLWKHSECNNDRRDRGLRQQLQGRLRLKNSGTREQLHVGNERTTSMVYRKTIGLEIVKRAVVEISSGLWGIRKWTLWRGRPPTKRKKRLCTEWEHRPLHELQPTLLGERQREK